MRSNDSKGQSRRSGRGPRRPSNSRAATRNSPPVPPAPTFWQKLIGFFKPKPTPTGGRRAANPPVNGEGRPSRKPDPVQVTSSKLYVGNLSYEATESDLHELFKGVGIVKIAEVVTHQYNERSKGFGFVTMMSIEEAKRAVVELHDKNFMGRKLVVTGAKSTEREPNYRG